MKFRIDKESWLPALQVAIGAVDRKQAIPLLGNLLVRASGTEVSVTGTDLDVEIVARASADVREEGETTLPARKLWEIWRNLPAASEAEVSATAERAGLRVGRSRFGLATLPTEGFPSAPEVEAITRFRLPMGRLRWLVEHTQFAMAQQDVRYYLNGLLFETRGRRLRAVGTDGHRLALCEAEVALEGPDELQQAIIPRKGVLELLRLGTDADEVVTVEVGRQAIRVVAAAVQLTSRLVEGRFPEYERVVPDPAVWDKHVWVERDALREALIRAAILANERYRAVRLSLGEGRVGIWAENAEKEEAEEEVAADYAGAPLEIGFNVSYLIDALSAIESGRVRLCFSDGNSSCLLQGEDEGGCRYVVMPMRL